LFFFFKKKKDFLNIEILYLRLILKKNYKKFDSSKTFLKRMHQPTTKDVIQVCNVANEQMNQRKAKV